jgi:YVTN family beta-propeller protein
LRTKLIGLAFASLVAACSHGSREPLVYVSNEDGGDVAVVEPITSNVVARIPVGKRPRGIKVSADGKLLYVALSGSPRPRPRGDTTQLPPADRSADGIAVVDLAQRKLIRTLAGGQAPVSFDFSIDGKTLYIANEETAEVSVLDLGSGVLRAKVPVGNDPEGVTVRPDGKLVYVTSRGSADLNVIDTATFAVVTKIPTGTRSHAIVFTKDGLEAFATSEFDSVTVLDVQKSTPSGTILFDPGDRTSPDAHPMGAVLSPDGNELYVSCGGGGSVAVVHVPTLKQTHLFERVGDRPRGIGVSRDGRRLYTANGPSDDLSIVDATTGRVEARVRVGRSPWGVAVGL